MPTSIRGRILNQAIDIVESIDGIGSVYRWSARATEVYAHLDAVIQVVEETSEQGAIGTAGTIRNTMTMLASIVIRPTESDAAVTDEAIDIWAAALKHAFLGNRTFVETATSVRLAVDSTPAVIDPPEVQDGACAAAVRVVVTYDHDGDSVYRMGTAIVAA